MAQSTIIAPKELERQAVLAFTGKTLKVMLCDEAAGDPLSVLTENDTVAEWQAAEKSGSGYSRFSHSIGPGSYNSTTGTYDFPPIDAEFKAEGGTLSYSRIVLYIEGEDYPHSIISENPTIALAVGQTQIYRITLKQSG